MRLNHALDHVIPTLTFKYGIGLRQGVVISSLFLSLFVEDLELFFQGNINLRS